MGFWLFMLLMNLLIPLTLLGFGHYFARGGPERINGTLGYRTALSMKNADTWAFAHRYCGKLWRALGLVLLPVSAAAMLPLLGRDADRVGLYGGLLCAVQVGLLIASIVPTERALKRTFDPSGRRKS